MRFFITLFLLNELIAQSPSEYDRVRKMAGTERAPAAVPVDSSAVSVQTADTAGTPAAQPAPSPEPAEPPKTSFTICSFKIEGLGEYKEKRNKHIAKMLSKYDLAVIQGLVAPPEKGTYPDGETYEGDPEAAAFFQAMKNFGFKYGLSKEDTGPGKKNHRHTPDTEWPVVFYKKEFEPAPDLPHGFIAEDVTKNKIFYRVPHAHAFRTKQGNYDFVIVNCHLWPDKGGRPKWKKRKKELKALAEWARLHWEKERDFFILGNMEISDGARIFKLLPEGWATLNDELDKTFLGDEYLPYDHVIYHPKWSAEIDSLVDQKELPLVEIMISKWSGPGRYPKAPYDYGDYPRYYSDHKPIYFKVNLPARDDD